MNYKGYKDLKCYIQSKLLRVYIFDPAKKFPTLKKFLLTEEQKCETAFRLINGYISYPDNSKNQKTDLKPNSEFQIPNYSKWQV